MLQTAGVRDVEAEYCFNCQALASFKKFRLFFKLGEGRGKDNACILQPAAGGDSICRR